MVKRGRGVSPVVPARWKYGPLGGGSTKRGERCRFTSRILPPYMRRSPKVAEVLPVLYLRGLSTGDFRPALETLLGEEAAGLSATNIARLTGRRSGSLIPSS